MTYQDTFLAFERKFQMTLPFVELDPQNFPTYSVEYNLLLLAVCSEFEAVTKDLCAFVQPGSNPSNIVDIFNTLYPLVPDMFNEEISLDDFGISVKPIQGWTAASRPSWWQSYNALKHDRTANYRQGNLENCVNALASLQIAVHYNLWKRYRINVRKDSAQLFIKNPPQIFRLNGVYYEGPTDDGFDI